MSDYLHDAACNFEKALKNSYELTIGNAKKQITLLIPSIESSEFTHIFGLDHLSDVDVLNAKNSTQKSAIFKKILSKQITLDDISSSKYLNLPITGSHNYRSGSEYTVNDRIRLLSNFENIMDNLYNGKVYKWNLNKCQIKLQNGSYRKTKINADYLITVPSKESNETIYLFAYQTNRYKSKSESISLNIFSAFPDGIDLTIGQDRPYTIIEEKKNKVSIYISPSYQKELEQRFVQTQLKNNDNVKQIKFDNSTPQNILHNNSGAAAVVLPAPNLFKNLIDRLKNIFKKHDKHVEVAAPVQTNDKTNISENKTIVNESPVSKELTALIEAREAFAAGNLPQSEYEQAVSKYMYSLHGREMWTEAAESLRKQLEECPDNMKKYIGYELKSIELNIGKKFPPQRQQTLDEIKSAAHEQYVKLQTENKAAEKEITTENNKTER